MLRRRMTQEQVEALRQYSDDKGKYIKLEEHRNLLGNIDSIEVIFHKGEVGTAYRERFVRHINTSRNSQFMDVANDITALLYTPARDIGEAVQRAYAEKS